MFCVCLSVDENEKEHLVCNRCHVDFVEEPPFSLDSIRGEVIRHRLFHVDTPCVLGMGDGQSSSTRIEFEKRPVFCVGLSVDENEKEHLVCNRCHVDFVEEPPFSLDSIRGEVIRHRLFHVDTPCVLGSILLSIQYLLWNCCTHFFLPHSTDNYYCRIHSIDFS